MNCSGQGFSLTYDVLKLCSVQNHMAEKFPYTLKTAIPISCSLGSASSLPLCYAHFNEESIILFTIDGSASTLLLNVQTCTGFAALHPFQIRLTVQRERRVPFQKRVMVPWFQGSYFIQSFFSTGESQKSFPFHRQYFNISVLFLRDRMRKLGFHLLEFDG